MEIHSSSSLFTFEWNEFFLHLLIRLNIYVPCHHRESWVFYHNFYMRKYFHSHSFPLPLVLSLVGSFLSFQWIHWTMWWFFCVVYKKKEIQNCCQVIIIAFSNFLLKHNFLGNIIFAEFDYDYGRMKVVAMLVTLISESIKSSNQKNFRPRKKCPGRSFRCFLQTLETCPINLYRWRSRNFPDFWIIYLMTFITFNSSVKLSVFCSRLLLIFERRSEN